MLRHAGGPSAFVTVLANPKMIHVSDINKFDALFTQRLGTNPIMPPIILETQQDVQNNTHSSSSSSSSLGEECDESHDLNSDDLAEASEENREKERKEDDEEDDEEEDSDKAQTLDHEEDQDQDQVQVQTRQEREDEGSGLTRSEKATQKPNFYSTYQMSEELPIEKIGNKERWEMINSQRLRPLPTTMRSFVFEWGKEETIEEAFGDIVFPGICWMTISSRIKPESPFFQPLKLECKILSDREANSGLPFFRTPSFSPFLASKKNRRDFGFVRSGKIIIPRSGSSSSSLFQFGAAESDRVADRREFEGHNNDGEEPTEENDDIEEEEEEEEEGIDEEERTLAGINSVQNRFSRPLDKKRRY